MGLPLGTGDTQASELGGVSCPLDSDAEWSIIIHSLNNPINWTTGRNYAPKDRTGTVASDANQDPPSSKSGTSLSLSLSVVHVGWEEEPRSP